MPGIGAPQTQNPYKGISMKKKPQVANSLKVKDDVGEKLNRMAGIKEENQFVDRAKHNKLDKDGFLKLLSHQLANQDPLKPMDQKKFASDLAQFSQLEQMANMNKNLEGMKANKPDEGKFYGASFLGKKVMTKGTSLDYSGQGTVDVPFYLPKNARNVMVRVFDSSNQLIAQIEQENLPKGGQSITWNGVSLDGTRAVKDTYRVDVMAWDKDLNQFKGETKAEGVVTGVSFENGETVLNVDGKKRIFLRDVESFRLPMHNKNEDVVAKKGPEMQKQAQSAYQKHSEN